MKNSIIAIFIILGVGAVCLVSQAPVAAAALRSPAWIQAPRGKSIYDQNCLPCHQQDGGGVPGMNPPLSKSPYVQGSTTRLIHILLQGLNDGVDIEGETYSNPMPPFGTTLKDGDIADVLSYVRSHFGNKAAPVSAAQVSKIRQGLTK